MSGFEAVSLGCRLNIAESAKIAALVDAEADLVVVNSCAVTAQAMRQSRRAVRQARARRPDARIVVTGCASDIDPATFAGIADAVVPNSAKLAPQSWHAHLRPPGQPAPDSTAHTRAFVEVQNGCDHACTFCVIPQGRGPSRSRAVDSVVAEVASLVDAGLQEVVLTGVDVTSWGHDLPGAPRLGGLVAAIVDRVPSLPRLRLSSLDGIEIDPLLFELITQEARVMPHVHLSLQSGDDMILKRMKRRHSRGEAIALSERLRGARPEIAIGADLMAGFPTEDAVMHAANVAVVRECGVVHGHVFPYSPRPGTPAARMPQVDPALVKDRAADLRAAVAEERSRWLGGLVGSTHAVLAERDGTGHAPNFARFRLPEGTAPGRITHLTARSLADGLLEGHAT